MSPPSCEGVSALRGSVPGADTGAERLLLLLSGTGSGAASAKGRNAEASAAAAGAAVSEVPLFRVFPCVLIECILFRLRLRSRLTEEPELSVADPVPGLTESTGTSIG